MKKCKERQPVIYWDPESKFYCEEIEEPLSADIKRLGYTVLAVIKKIRQLGISKVLDDFFDELA